MKLNCQHCSPCRAVGKPQQENVTESCRIWKEELLSAQFAVSGAGYFKKLSECLEKHLLGFYKQKSPRRDVYLMKQREIIPLIFYLLFHFSFFNYFQIFHTSGT